MKKKSIWLFIAIICLIVSGIFYTVSLCLDPEDTKREEQLKSLEKQISAYRSDDPYTYYILENLYEEKGNIYRHNGEYSEAYNCYREAIQFAKKDKNHRHVAELAWFMIQLAAEQKQSALVLTLSKKYQKVIVQHDYYPFNLYYWWGMAYLTENNLEAAQKPLNKGLKYLNSKRDYNYSEQKVMIYCALNTIYARKQDFSKCEEYLSKTNKLFTEYCTLSTIEYSDHIYISNAAYLSLKSSLMEIEKNNPPRSVALGEAYRRLAECYKYKAPKNYKINMLKAIKMYPPTSPQIGEVYFELGDFFYKEKKYYFDKCVPALTGAKSNSAAEMLLSVALTIIDKTPEKAFPLLQLAFKALPDSNRDPSITARIFKRFAYCYFEKKDLEKAAMYAKKSFDIAKNLDIIKYNFEFVLGCYGYVDDLYKSQNKIKKRVKNAEDLIAFMKTKEGDWFPFNEAYAMLGEIYKLDKRYSDAEKAYREITKTFAKNPKRREKLIGLRQEIDAYCEIGDLCLLQNAKKRAKRAFDKASILLKRKTVDDLAEWYFTKRCMDIANGYYYLKKDKLAEKYYKKLLTLLLAKNTKDNRAIAYVYYRIGQIGLGKKKLQRSQDYLKKGLKFALIAYEKQKSKYGNNLTTGMCAADIGYFYDKLKQKDKALEFLQLAHQLLKKYGESQPELAERISRHIKKIKK